MESKRLIAEQPLPNPGKYGLVITCEHGGSRIPTCYKRLFYDHQALLDSHRGFDVGALSMAKSLATALMAPLVYSRVSRLLVDLNRSPTHPNLHFKTVHQLSKPERNRILQRYYLPYREQVDRLLRNAIATHGQVIHVSSHSFTPELDGRSRNADIGLLYDPSRADEVALCKYWQQTLTAKLPELKVRRNYPYAGKGDGQPRWFRRLLPGASYLGIELEINQKHILEASEHWVCLRQSVVDSLREALDRCYS
ncbi:N-formylglutamate amidohydrolase [Methylomonas sp. BW4-1]|uniref:N-formylglutamate amidohydrolase n=1 Tax=Methylomonas sp. BW4-1 TaxID=3376685 RepID=UPI0040423080